jgi:RNA polymerase sigma-70 factor, ECF subfamily
MHETAATWATTGPPGIADERDEPLPTDLAALDEADMAAARLEPGRFGPVYVRHRLAVFRYVRGRVRTDDEAADLAATTFERAIAALATYRPHAAGARPWLLRIARNAAIDAARRRRPHVPLDAAASVPASVNSLDAAPDGRDIELLDLVRSLPDTQRDAVLLRYAAGLSAAEIGAVLGKSPAAVQKLIERARAALRKDFER